MPLNFNHLRKFLILAGIILFANFTICISQPELPKSVANIGELETYIKKLTDYGIPQGISMVVVKDTQIVYSKGFGWADRPKQISAAPESVYHWFSITKVVTALCILQLEERGKLKIEDKVTKYLPFFEVKYPSDTSRQITILNLLNHSSGIKDATIDLIRWVHHYGESPVNQTDMIKKALPKYSKLIYEPGTQNKYTNVGYMVLAAIIEKVSGQSYDEYVRQNVLIPLGMNHTDFLYTKTMGKNEAAGAHHRFDMISVFIKIRLRSYVAKTYKSHIWFKRFYNDQEAPSGLIGPVTDLALLTEAYINKGELNGKRILSEESIGKMTNSGFIMNPGDDPNSFVKKGIAWMVDRKPDGIKLSHTGAGLGFTTALQLFPEKKIGIAVFSNDTKCKPWQIADLASTLEW